MKKQIAIVAILLLGIAVSVFLSQRQQIFKSRASLQAYNAFAIKSGDSEHYVNCTGNVCETNTLNITISVADLQALNIQEQQGTAVKTDEQCQGELGEPPPFCDLNTCIKNKAVAKDNQCRFEPERVDLALCPNNCQSNGTQSILCYEVETCEKYQNGKLTGNLIKRWFNETYQSTEGCQVDQKISDKNKCPADQVLSSGQYTASGGGLTGQVNAGTAPIPFCSAQDYATPCWMGADCKEENQVYANKACSNNHGAGSKCTRSTGASDVFEDGCTQPESNVVADSCSGQYITACWQGADCKEENQASANAVCSQNHGPESVCTRATGMGNVYEDGCTYGSSSQIAAGIKQTCTSEAYATSCWIEARCDETNQRFADRTCINNHGEGSVCTRSTGIPGTSDDGCTKTVVDVAQERRARAAQSPACVDIEECDEKTATRKIYPCGQQPAIEVSDTSCSPDLSPDQAIDLNLESKRQAAIIKKQEAEKQDKPFWEKAGDLAGGLWSGIISLGKGIQEAPTLGEVNQANAAAFNKNIQSFLGENQRGVESFNQASPECQEAASREIVGLPVDKELLEKCFVESKTIDDQAAEAEACALEFGDVKACLSKTGVNMNVGEAKIAKTGICIPNIFTIIVNRCVGFTGESVVPADASQNLSEVLRKAEVVKLAENLGLNLDLNPKDWDKAKREFFFHAAARTDLNAAKYAAEFFGIPITAWENADKAAKICARDHKYACFVDSSMPASSWIQSASNEQIDQLNKISQNYFRGFEPASPELLRKYGYLVDVSVLNQTGKQFGKPLEISAEDWDKVLRTFRVYAQTGDNIKNNTAAGRLYQEKQTQAEVESYIGLVSTVVDPIPVAQVLSSSLKYVVVKQVYKRLSERFGSKVASEIVQNAEKAIARGGIATAAERNAVEDLAEAAGLPPMSNPADQIRIMVDSGVVEPPPAVAALRNAVDDPEVQRIAAQGIPTYHNGSGKLDDMGVVVSPPDTHFVDPDMPVNPVRAVQDGVNDLVDDAARLLNNEPAPVVEVAERVAEPHSNPVLAQVADTAEPGKVPLADVADNLAEAEARLLGEAPLPPNPAAEMWSQTTDGMKSWVDDLAGHPCPAGSVGVQCKITANTVPSIGHPERNEDAVFHDAQKGVAMVLDGVGGHGAGDMASSTAQKFLAEAIGVIDDTNPQIVGERMRQALIDASKQVYRETSPELKEIGRRTKQYPGTTASVVKVVEHNGQQVAVIGNVGDSRVYAFRDGKLVQLTKDDDYGFPEKVAREISEAQRRSDLSSEAQGAWGMRNQIDQMLGGTITPDPRMSVVPLKPGDRLIVTSDGVHDNLTRTEIEQILKSNPQNPSQELMERALARSRDTNHFRYKKDDITAAVVDIPSDKASPPLQQAARGIQSIWENLRSVVSPQKIVASVSQKSKKFQDAQSWEEFFRLLDAKGQVIGSDGTVYTASQIKKTALAVKSGEAELENLTRSDGVRETAERLRNAPCPIFSLIPIAYAQGAGGGFNPCPKNPFAALARNAGNAGRQVGDTVSGWVDNFKGVFKRGGKEEGIMKIEGQSNIAETKQLFDEIKSAGNSSGNLNGVLHRKVSFDQYGAAVANFTRFKARIGDNLLLGTTHTNTPAERALIDQFFEEVVKRDIDTVYFEQAPLNAEVDLKLWLSSNGYISQETAQLLGSNVDGSELNYLFEKLTKRGIKVINMDLSYNPSVSALVFAIEHYGIERTVRDLNQHLYLVSQNTLLSSLDHLSVDVLRSEKIPEIITRLINEAGGNIDTVRVKSLIEGRDFILEDLFTDAEREAYMLSVITGKKYAVAAHSAHTSALAEKLFGTQKLQDLQLYVDGDKVSRVIKGQLGDTQLPVPKTFLQTAKDTVGGWVDNFKGVFRREGKEVLPGNLNFEEQSIMKSAERVSNITFDEIRLLDNVAKKVAEQAEQFDYVVVTGGSRDVSLVLLQKQGVNPKKIIEFDEYLNNVAYKDLSEFPNLPQDLTDEQRTNIIRDALIAKGVPLEGLDNPRILIVDDIARSGGKTVEYLRRFGKIEGIGEYKFAVFASQFNNIELGNPLIFGTTPEELQKFPQLVFIPKGLTKEEGRDAYLLLNDLANTVSVKSKRAFYADDVSGIVLAKVDEAASTGLQRIRSSSKPKNFFEQDRDTVQN